MVWGRAALLRAPRRSARRWVFPRFCSAGALTWQGLVQLLLAATISDSTGSSSQSPPPLRRTEAAEVPVVVGDEGPETACCWR